MQQKFQKRGSFLRCILLLEKWLHLHLRNILRAHLRPFLRLPQTEISTSEAHEPHQDAEGEMVIGAEIHTAEKDERKKYRIPRLHEHIEKFGQILHFIPS